MINYNDTDKVDYIDVNYLHMNRLPDNVKISTISSTCKIDTKFDAANIFDTLIVDDINIDKMKYGNKLKLSDGIYELKSKPKKRVHFFNQITVVIILESLRKINVKLFKNGAIQMTGCKNVDDYNILFNKILYILKKNRTDENNLLELKDKYIISDFKINMINSNFNVNFNINRDKLYNYLLKKNVKCRYEPCNHACVNIKIPSNIDTNEISIFVFEKGSIIITGAKSGDHILEAHNYIINELNSMKSNITKIEVINVLDDLLNQLLVKNN